MKKKHIAAFASILLLSNIICMNESKSLKLSTAIEPLPYINFSHEKSPCMVNFNNREQAFENLTKNKASLLKNMVAKEQRGNYCHELYKAIQVIDTVHHAGSTNFFNKIENLETINFLNDISKKPNDYNKLISTFNNEDIYIGNILLKCRKILVKNRYIVNTYGSCEPYPDRIITPLHYALTKISDGLWSPLKGIEYCKLLLSCGANPNARDDFGNTPMHYASHPDFIDLLCSYGAKINMKGYCGRTPLLNNIRLCNGPLIKCLLQYSANPNKKDSKGNTPLNKALTKKYNSETVLLLLECGADWTLEDGKNKGRLVGYTEALRVLRNHINIHIKDLLVKEFNLAAITKIINSPCIYIIDTEMGDELMKWITEEQLIGNPGVDALYEYLYAKRGYFYLRG